MKAFFLFLFVLSLQSCVTGSVLRTARVLEKNQLEISGGVAQSHVGSLTQVVIAAYGIANSFEIESRWEDEYISLTPRVQLLRSEDHWLDCLIFFEGGYAFRNGWLGEHGWLGGTGIIFGKRFDKFSPYLAYKYRYFDSNIHYIKFGGRYYLPPFWKPEPTSKSAWFIGAECGLTMFSLKDNFFEWAANLGFNF